MPGHGPGFTLFDRWPVLFLRPLQTRSPVQEDWGKNVDEMIYFCLLWRCSILSALTGHYVFGASHHCTDDQNNKCAAAHEARVILPLEQEED